MNLAAGSTLWLLQHELRLQWRAIGQKVNLGLMLGLALVFLHVVAIPLAILCRHVPSMSPTVLLMGVTGGLLILFLLMMSSGIVAAMQTLYARGDMDLLLSSPLQPRAIIVVRAVAIAVTVCGTMCVLILPFANMLAIFVTAKWLMVYVALLSLAALGTGASLIAAHGMFRLLGPRRARLFAQVLAGVLATVMMLLTQIPNALSASARENAASGLIAFVNSAPGPDSWLWLPARAFTGEPMALAVAVIASFGLFALATMGLADRLIGNTIVATGVAATRKTTRSDQPRRFNTATVSVLRRKELRLLARDPWLLTQIAQQMIFVVPLGVVLWKNGVNGIPTAWLMLVLIAGMLSAGLAWLAMSGEDAPDLLEAAPVQRFEVLRAKLEAVLIPVGLALLVPIAVAWRADAWLGLTLVVCCAASAFTGILLHVLFPSRGKRSEFNKRARARMAVGLAEMLLAMGWGLTGYLMLRHTWWALLPALLLLPLPATTKIFR